MPHGNVNIANVYFAVAQPRDFVTARLPPHRGGAESRARRRCHAESKPQQSEHNTLGRRQQHNNRLLARV